MNPTSPPWAGGGLSRMARSTLRSQRSGAGATDGSGSRGQRSPEAQAAELDRDRIAQGSEGPGGAVGGGQGWRQPRPRSAQALGRISDSSSSASNSSTITSPGSPESDQHRHAGQVKVPGWHRADGHSQSLKDARSWRSRCGTKRSNAALGRSRTKDGRGRWTVGPRTSPWGNREGPPASENLRVQ